MNTINQDQITDKNLARIFYFRKLYSHCKYLRGIALFLELSIIVWAIIFPLSSIINYKKEATFITMISIVLIYALKYIQSCIKEKAALVQDLFDRELFGMKWNKARGLKPSEKEIIAFKNKHPDEFLGDEQELVNWYVDVKGLPKHLAISLCQKDNVIYESSNRKIYNNLLIIISIVTLCLGIYMNMSEPLVYAILGFLPFVPLALDLFFHRINSIKTLKTLESIDSSIEAVLHSSQKPKKAIADLDHIQCSIFEYRKTVEPVPDRLFWWRRRTEHLNREEYFRDLKNQLLTKKGKSA